MQKFYTAAPSRNQGRGSWSVIFRHPTRHDANTGKPGRRVRRGLGTADEHEARTLVEQLNDLLSSPELWEPAARARAVDRFDERVVDIFYEGAEASRLDFEAVRDEALVLPGRDDGYRRVLFLGATGAGKTTVVRQILGTDPEKERFPSTSTGKTTVADTELVLTAEDDFKAVVTFVPREEVVDYLTENVVKAALDVFNGRSEAQVIEHLLDHVNQKFRFSYILGRGLLAATDVDGDIDSEDIDSEDIEDVELGLLLDDDADGEAVDMAETEYVLEEALSDLRQVVDAHDQALRDEIELEKEEDERVAQELVEEDLENVLRQSEEFHHIVDRLSDEIEKRFSTLTEGNIRRNRQGWPISWTWETDDRERFIRVVSRFTSNNARLFGRLLTPLVNGIRVSGPFSPPWSDAAVPLVLIDGEGLGHDPKSAANLSTTVTQRFDDIDAILLVDNATGPVQAAATAAMKAITISGHADKLHFLFTHFDQVGGDNLPTFSSREQHVLASVENVLTVIGDDLGPHGERALRKRVESASFFVGGIQDALDEKKKVGRRSVAQLQVLLEALSRDPEKAEIGPSRPVYDRMNLALAVAAAAEAFHSKWWALLGLRSSPVVDKQHWTRIKALSRRLAEGWADEYDNLKPISDLYYELHRQVYLMLQRPVRWEHDDHDDETQQLVISAISQAVTRKLIQLTRKRLIEDRLPAWQEAYIQRGTGSTFDRARIIADEVYDRGAPVPGVAASPDQNDFLKAVAQLLVDVSQELEMMVLD
jgi:hypothetical protein